jgi:hypothetical protein
MISQSPRPFVAIYGPGGDLKFTFYTEDASYSQNRSVLQAYSFSTSINDPSGKFSLTFYPDENPGISRKEDFFDKVKVLDIVEIYEYIQPGRVYPSFAGVIKEKKYVSQAGESSVSRRIMVSGYSITSLVQEFKINLDLHATSITADFANQELINKEFTDKIWEKEGVRVKDLVKTVWEYFLDLSGRYSHVVNLKIAGMIKRWLGEDFFSCDESAFKYPLGCIYNPRRTQSFYDVIYGIVPSPV